MSSSKERQNAIKRLKTFLFSQKIDLKNYREKIDEEFSDVFLPNRVELDEVVYGGVKCDVLKPEMFSSKRLMIYIHGGCFIAGSRKSHRAFASSLANTCSCVTIVPEFRLAPSHPFPFSVNDVQEVFREIYNEYNSRLDDLDEFASTLPEIILAADGSGASIALGFLLNLKPTFRSAISKVVLFSPWLDLSEENPKLTAKKGGDEVFTTDSIKLCAENYATAEKRNQALVSPLLASESDFEKFPKVYIQVGEKEMFAEDSQKFSELLLASGVECEIDVWPDMMTLFQLVDEQLAESHLAIEKIGKLVTKR